MMIINISQENDQPDLSGRMFATVDGEGVEKWDNEDTARERHPISIFSTSVAKINVCN